MTNTTSAEIRSEIETRDEQYVLSVLADGLPHVWTTKETTYRAVRRLAKKGRVQLSPMARGSYAVRSR